MRIATLLTILAVQALPAQSLASRVAAAPDGLVQLTYPSRPNVCGDGVRMIAAGNAFYSDASVTVTGNIHHGADFRARCVPGPVRVTLTVRGGAVQELRLAVGGRDARPAEGTDLGAVPAQAATDYLLGLAPRLERKWAGHALLAAVMAADVVVWPRLLAVARDDAAPRDTRQQATYWLGRFAAAHRDGSDDPFEEMGSGDDDRTAAKREAVFALSQLPRHEGLDDLLQIARTHPDPDIRAHAMFWAGESGDPRALDLFEEVLRRR